MDAYEGETVRLQQPYPLCDGMMEEGFLFDLGAAGSIAMEWVAGAPQVSRWTGLNLRHARRYATATFRCKQCSFLASFATTPLTDG